MTGLFRGAAAGAAGTTALNAITYLDMVVRARPSSSTPEQLVQSMAHATNVEIPGSSDQKENRVQGLGPLLGSGVGIAVGAVAGSIHHLLLRRGRRLPFVVGAVLVAAAAMATSDLPLKLFGVSDPARWSASDWVSDVIPHLGYGVVTEAVIRATEA